MQQFRHLIDGKLVPSADGRWRDLVNPADGQVFAQVADGAAADVAAATHAAARAAPGWADLAPSARSAHLESLARAIEARLDDFASLESRNAGKPLALARDVEIPRAVWNLRFFSHAATQFASESHHGEAGLNYTLRLPLGVVACISPWNLPLYLFTWKIAPALAAGNAVVAKPSEITPATAALLGAVSIEAGLPPGVLNIVHGDGPGVGEPLIANGAVRAISFTGSTAVGCRIATVAAASLKKISLELGGKNPTLVFADSDWQSMLDGIVRSAFLNSGQICLCGSRLLVEAPIADEFREAFVAKVQAIVVGAPDDPATTMGPLVSAAHRDRILAAIEQARAEGGRILTGGQALPGEGFYIEPTVIDGLGPDCATNREEIFGPVVSLQSFRDDEEALALANACDYGLAASVYTNNLRRAHAMAAELQVGIVWINTWLARDLRTPFGGVGQSGIGREGGMEAMRFFTETRNVSIATA